MSTILDSLKKSSDQRGGKDNSAINNFSFANDKAPSKSTTFIIIIILFIVTIAAMYWGYHYLYKDDSVADSGSVPAEKLLENTDDKTTDAIFKAAEVSDKSANSQLETLTIENKKPKPDSAEVKQELIDLQANNSRVNETLADLNKPQTVKDEISKPDTPIKSDIKIEGSDKDVQEENEQAIQKEQKQQPKVQTQKYLYVYQLPFNIRKDIPKLNLNIHVYDEDPAKRIAIINGVRFSINDSIEENITLLDIIAEGVLLEFSGEKFLIPK
ncbi:MAG: general secretion pathway protein GspB [Alcanivoracaceae bacterium]|nr:general secretion pathway protein GspB [Alcanivoracaceae bacterium]